MSTFFKHCRSYSPKPRGFTLVELIVVSAIILLITAFILFQQGKFNSSTLLRSLTYSVALSVRQAQIYGTSVRESSPGSGIFSSGYGVEFDASLACTLSAWTCYALFPDINSNGVYDSGSEAAPVATLFNLGSGYTISNICVTPVGGGALQCQTGTGTAINALTVYFRRPNPDACFATNLVPGACASASTPATYSTAYIQLKSSGNNDTRSIKVSSTGQIAVCAPNLTDLTAC